MPTYPPPLPCCGHLYAHAADCPNHIDNRPRPAPGYQPATAAELAHGIPEYVPGDRIAWTDLLAGAPRWRDRIITRSCMAGRHLPPIDLRGEPACPACGIYAQPADPDGTAAELVAELRARGSIDDGPEPDPLQARADALNAQWAAEDACSMGDPGCTLDHGPAIADERGAITTDEPGALYYIDPDENATEHPDGGYLATLHAEALDAGPESSSVAWLAVTVSTNGPERLRAVIELGPAAARTLADVLTAAVAMAADR